MPIRQEGVRFTLYDDYTPGVAKAAVITEAFERSLKSLDGTQTSVAKSGKQVDVSTRAQAKAMPQAGAAARSMGNDLQRAEKQIDSMSGRLSLLAEAAILLGPATIPLGAIAAPAVAGLASGLGATALAAGSAVIAFQGVGTALEAVNAAALEPTTENLEKARVAMEALSPAAQAAVTRMQSLRPTLTGIRDAAAGGFFPGFIESMSLLENRAPELERIVSTLGGTLGDLIAGGASALSDSEWDDFFDFLATDAADSLRDMGSAIGSLTAGMAELWMSMDPLSDMGTGWMRDAAAGFAEWAAGVDETDGFREFVEYIRETGPQLGETLSALGDAFLQIVEATAPLGGPVLQALEAFAKTIAAIADSDMGTPIMTAVAALTLLNRAMAITGKLTGTAGAGGAAAAGGGIFGSITKQTKAAGTGMRSLRSDLSTLSGSVVAFGRDNDRVAAAAGRMKDRLAAVGKVGGGVAAIGLVASGAADKMDAANTMTMALAGSMAGPLGAAAGAGVGALMDVKGGADGLRESIQAMNDAAASGDLTQMVSTLEQAKAQLKDMQFKAPGDDGFGITDALPGGIGAISTTKKLWGKVSGAEGGAETAIGVQESLIAVQRLVADSADEAARAQEGLGSSHEAAAARAQMNAAAQIEASNAILESRDATRSYEAAVDAAAEAAKKNGQTLDITTEAGRANQAALDAVAATWNRVNGTADASPAKFMRARKGVIDAAMAFGQTKKQAEGTARAIVQIPEKVSVELLARGIDPAKASARQLKDAIDALRGKTIEINMVTRRTVINAQVTAKRKDPGLNPADGATITAGGGMRRAAWGATVPDDGGAYYDRFPFLLAPLEEVVSNRRGQAERYRPVLKAINADAPASTVMGLLSDGMIRGRFADGGTIPGLAKGGTSKGKGSASFGMFDVRSLELTALKSALGGLTAAAERSAARLADETQARDSLVSSMESQHKSDLFGLKQSPFLSTSKGPLEFLRQDNRDLDERIRLQGIAKSYGLQDGAFGELASKTSLPEMKAFLSQGAAFAKEYQALYEQRESKSSASAALAGNLAYGKHVEILSAKSRQDAAHQKRVENRLERVEKAIEKSAQATGKATGKAVSGASSKGRKNHRGK